MNTEQRIQQWRRRWLAAAELSLDQADELESHLRDSIERLAAQGLSPEEAFLVAERRLGSPPQVGREFARVHPVNRWRRRAFWMLAGFILFDWLMAIHLAGTYGPRSIFSSEPHIDALGRLGIALVYLTPVGAAVLMWRMGDRAQHSNLGMASLLLGAVVGNLGPFVPLTLGLGAGEAERHREFFFSYLLSIGLSHLFALFVIAASLPWSRPRRGSASQRLART